MKRFLLSILLLLPTSVLAAPPPPASAKPAPTEEKSREDAIFGDEEEKPAPAKAKSGDEMTDLGDERMKGGDAKPNDELLYKDRSQIGGFLYLRTSASYNQGSRFSDTGLGNANLFDLYYDTRLNDRLRAFVRGRVLYNPLASAAQSAGVNSQSALGAPVSTDTTKALLNQMWLKFDIGRTVFVTVGQQFVRWGTTHIWNPVDVLNTTKVNPLAFFDERVGLPMLKLHIPIEKLGWNIYGIALTDSATTIERLGAALRLEMLFGHTEVGVASIFRKGVDPKLGLDVSSGLGPFDLTGEFGMVFPSFGSVQWQLAAGLSYTWAYREDDSLVLSVEYFHNDQGLTADGVYTQTRQAILAAGATTPVLPSFTPLYTYRDYIGATATVISPGSLNDAAFTAISLTNLTDGSGTAQLNFSNLFLTDLTVEAYAGVSYGDGELRGNLPYFQARLPTEPIYPSIATNPFVTAFMALHAPLVRAGVNLRVNL
jgi:hypothetical protein